MDFHDNIDYPPLLRFMTEVYQHPGIPATVHFDHIKRHYYGTHRDLNPGGIIPLGAGELSADFGCYRIGLGGIDVDPVAQLRRGLGQACDKARPTSNCLRAPNTILGYSVRPRLPM